MINTRLTDLQSLLLSAASRHDAGSLIPVPDSVASKQGAVQKALSQLLKRGLVTESSPPPAGAEWRTDGQRRFGLILTGQGLAAIGVTSTRKEAQVDELPSSARGPAAPVLSEAAIEEDARRGLAPTKSATVIALMRRKQGATLAELVEATGWLPHTTRAALTGLRKKGHSLHTGKRGDATCYTIARAGA